MIKWIPGRLSLQTGRLRKSNPKLFFCLSFQALGKALGKIICILKRLQGTAHVSESKAIALKKIFVDWNFLLNMDKTLILHLFFDCILAYTFVHMHPFHI